MRVINDFYIGQSTRYIKIVREGMSTYISGRTQGFRVKLTAVASHSMPLEIFVYQHLPFPDAETGYQDRFVNIASPNDLEEYNVGEVGDATRPFFRLAGVDLLYRNEGDLSLAVDKILADIGQLVESLNFMDKLEVVEEVIIGVPPTSSSSSSSSSSPSA
jgi:hypothetical protein